MNFISRLFAVIIMALILSACQADHEEAKVPVDRQPTEKKLEKPVADVKKEVVAIIKQVIEEPKIQTSVDLNVSGEFLKQIDDKEQNYLSVPPPPIGEEVTKKRKVKISGGVLLDTDKVEMVDKVDGGKVNISIPLN
jgi:hypothetical protein